MKFNELEQLKQLFPITTVDDYNNIYHISIDLMHGVLEDESGNIINGLQIVKIDSRNDNPEKYDNSSIFEMLSNNQGLDFDRGEEFVTDDNIYYIWFKEMKECEFLNWLNVNGDCIVIHGCKEDNSINEQISPMEKDMSDDEYPDISDLHLKTHGEKEKETIDHVIENSGDVFERTGVYATVVYHETNSNHPRFHCAYIMKHEASPNLFYYIHAGDDICPYCGAIDSQCLCDLDDEDDAYTKEEINEMLHDYGYNDDLFHIEETEKEVPLDINDSILSKLSNGTFDEHIKDIYKDATNVYSGTHDEITEFLNSNTVDDIENDDAMTQYIAAILLLCERLQLIHSIQTDDILLAVESMLHSEPSNNQPQESKEMSIPTTTEDVKKYVKSIVSNTNITIQKNELLKLLTQYFGTILDDINDNYDKFILDEITEAFSCLFALMTVEPDINEFIDEILDIFTSPVKYRFRYDMIKNEMASCIHYISNFNDKFHHKYGFISGFGALFQIIEAYGIDLGKLIHDAYIMYMRLFM